MLVAVGVALALYFTGVFKLNGQSEIINIVHCVVIAILMDVTGVYGDLIESQWKRNFEVKDSGTLIPGHGGLMDRFDSALIAIPVAIAYLVIIDSLFC
jgi:phosphatidate cytidylyltransferase